MLWTLLLVVAGRLGRGRRGFLGFGLAAGAGLGGGLLVRRHLRVGVQLEGGGQRFGRG